MSCCLASLTGFRWNTFVAWMQGVASPWDTTLNHCWRANQESETKTLPVVLFIPEGNGRE